MASTYGSALGLTTLRVMLYLCEQCEGTEAHIDVVDSSRPAAARTSYGMCTLTHTGCRTGADFEEGHWALSAACVRSSRLRIRTASWVGLCCDPSR